MKIALVSLDQVWEDKTKNFTSCIEYIKKAASEKVDVIIFPEMTLTGFSMNKSKIAENIEGSESIIAFMEIAKNKKIAIIFGVVIKDKNKTFNHCVFVDSKGEIISTYSKIHLFSFAEENKFFDSGDKISNVLYMGYNFGITICYDLRFPELYSALAKNSDIIINIANWPQTRIDHWLTLLKARAIENQVNVVGVNRVGVDGNGIIYEESSHVFNPNGKRLNEEIYGKMKIISLDAKSMLKTKFQTSNDRLVKLYKDIL